MEEGLLQIQHHVLVCTEIKIRLNKQMIKVCIKIPLPLLYCSCWVSFIINVLTVLLNRCCS